MAANTANDRDMAVDAEKDNDNLRVDASRSRTCVFLPWKTGEPVEKVTLQTKKLRDCNISVSIVGCLWAGCTPRSGLSYSMGLPSPRAVMDSPI